jgi:pimeloyl-ACP methyl ester carboxylesterase
VAPPRRFAVEIPEETLDDLRIRLERTRWIDDFPDTAWELGVSRSYLEDLCDYWRTGFDWRVQEAQLNSYDQYVFDADGQPIHFVHTRSPQPEALPLLLIHGWPASVFEYIKVLDPLSRPGSLGAAEADSFHVVAPSIPGYGFSGPTLQRGWGPARIASAFGALMSDLGYDRYGVAGGDWGAIIGTELARLDGGAHVCGLHLTMPLGEPPRDGDLDVLTAPDQRGLDDWAAHQAAGNVVHVMTNSTRPHTLAFGLNDSPVGLAAWLIDKYRAYSDCGGDVESAFTRDELLTEVTTYWVTGTIASASRLYYERAGETRRRDSAPPTVKVTTGCAIFPNDVRRVPRPWAERVYANIERWTEMPSGGHFPGLEEPELLVADMREFFRTRR